MGKDSDRVWPELRKSVQGIKSCLDRHLDLGGVQPDEGLVALQGPVEVRLHALVNLGAEPAINRSRPWP